MFSQKIKKINNAMFANTKPIKLFFLEKKSFDKQFTESTIENF